MRVTNHINKSNMKVKELIEALSYYKYCRSEFFCTVSLPLEKSSVDLCVL